VNRLVPAVRPALAAAALVTGISFPVSAQASRLAARPGTAVEPAPAGWSRLAIPGGRETMLYLPGSCAAGRPTPLLVLLHGATQSSDLWTRSDSLGRLAREHNVALLLPNAVATTWDLMRGGFGPDVARLDSSLAGTFRRCAIDPARIALGGFSDGATYALSLGVANGDLFDAVIGFSPGFFAPERPQGKPRIFLTHGTGDRILPINQTSRQIVPILTAANYDLTYREFEGGHTIRLDDMRDAFAWFLGGRRQSGH
jgi:phospholipase/carboxylesterase